MKLKNNGKINFIIDLFLDLDNYMSGGLIALHKLAYVLAEKGHNVYVFCKPGYPHENITVIPSKVNIIEGHRYGCTWEAFSYNPNTTVSIYPEHSIKNKFNTKHNVRWIMYHTTKENEENFNDSDYIFNYGNFKTHTKRSDGILRVIDYNTETFFNENGDREGFCFIHGKQTPENYKDLLKIFNYDDISHIHKKQTDLNLLRKIFNKYEFFITFDEKTYLTTAAALCGCKVIILTDQENKFGKKTYVDVDNKEYDIYEKLTPTEYRIQNSINMYGVAYGLEDITWAQKTTHMVKDHIKNLEKIDKKHINKFIELWEEKCYGE